MDSWIDRWIAGSHALHDSHATRLRDAGSLTTPSSIDLSIHPHLSIHLGLPVTLGDDEDGPLEPLVPRGHYARADARHEEEDMPAAREG